jgi:Tfp pilus assembly protein FimT
MTKPGMIVVSVFAVLFALGYTSTRMASSRRRVHAIALVATLQQLYDAAIVTNQADSVSQDLVPATVRQRLLNRLESVPQVLPSFVDTDNIYVTQRALPVQSTNLFLVIKAANKLIYGITADRQPKALSYEEFDAWSHERL